MSEPTWVPEACTLPTRERPLRVAEFDALFVNALHHWVRPDAGLLRLFLDAGCEAELRELTIREAACCSFFTFAISEAKDHLTLEISVSAGHEPVLDTLSARLPTGATVSPSPTGSSCRLSNTDPG
jgi:hypothetical protein